MVNPPDNLVNVIRAPRDRMHRANVNFWSTILGGRGWTEPAKGNHGALNQRAAISVRHSKHVPGLFRSYLYEPVTYVSERLLPSVRSIQYSLQPRPPIYSQPLRANRRLQARCCPAQLRRSPKWLMRNKMSQKNRSPNGATCELTSFADRHPMVTATQR